MPNGDAINLVNARSVGYSGRGRWHFDRNANMLIMKKRVMPAVSPPQPRRHANISSRRHRRSSRSLLEFKTVPATKGAVRMWAAANSEYAFRIALTRRFLEEAGDGEKIICVKAPKPVFVAYVSFPDSSHRCRIDRKFKTFDAAVRLCSKATREMRRQVAYHEAGHAVVAWLLGYTGIWIDMKFDKRRAVTGWRCNNLTPAMLTDGALLDGGGDPEYRSAFVRALHDELIVAVAGLVAEVQIAGYRTGYVEPEVLGRAVQLVRACRSKRLFLHLRFYKG
jgi:hypothetical protein